MFKFVLVDMEIKFKWNVRCDSIEEAIIVIELVGEKVIKEGIGNRDVDFYFLFLFVLEDVFSVKVCVLSFRELGLYFIIVFF